MSKFYNTSLDKVPNSGGSNRVSIPADPFKIRGGTGTGGATSVPCKECWIEAANGDSSIRVNIGSAPSTTTGIHVPEQGTDYRNLHIPIDDLNKLYFIGAASTDRVDILYRE